MKTSKAKYIELNSDKTPKTNFDTFYDSYDSLENAGLILDKNVVVVDFDMHPEIAEQILLKYKTKAVKTTRGYHLYFKVPKNMTSLKSKTHTTTVYGNVVDYKTGQHSDKVYAIVKLNGHARTVFNENLLIELPLVLYPTNTNIDLIGLDKGSRNSSLYKHLLNVADYDPNPEKLLAIAKHINSNFRIPIKNDELENIINSVLKNIKENPNIFDPMSKKILIDKLAAKVIKTFGITSYEGTIYYKDKNRYFSDEIYLLKKVYDLGFTLTKTQDRELMHQIQKLIATIDKNENLDLPIILNNGYQIKNGEVEMITGEFTPLYLNVDYNSEAYDPVVDNFLNWFVSDDIEMRQLIEEILGHILMLKSFPQHSFFFVGNTGKNGKSTFFEMLQNFMGNLSTSISLDEMEDPRNLSGLKDKLVNCGDDIDNSYIKSSRIFKTLSAGNKIMSKKLYFDPTEFKNKATLLFSCNEMPKFKDKSGGIERRVKIIPCENSVEKVDLTIDSKLSTENAKSYLLNLALKGFHSIANNGGVMISPEKSNLVTQEYLIESSPVKRFYQFCEDKNISIENELCSMVFTRFQVFCESEGMGNIATANTLTRGLKEYGFSKKRVRIGNDTLDYKYIKD